MIEEENANVIRMMKEINISAKKLKGILREELNCTVFNIPISIDSNKMFTN